MPKPIIVSPNGIFHKCPVCSRNSLKNRMNADIFMCISCGHTDSIQKIGGMNLATRILRNKKDKIVFNVSFIGDEVEYSNNSLSFIYRCKKDTNANVEFYSFLLSFLNNFVPSSRMESSIARKLIATSNIHDVVMLLEQ